MQRLFFEDLRFDKTGDSDKGDGSIQIVKEMNQVGAGAAALLFATSLRNEFCTFSDAQERDLTG